MRLPGRRRTPLSAAEDFQGALRVACDRLGLSVLSYDGDCVQVVGRRLSGTIAVDDLRARCLLLPRESWTQVLTDALQALALSREAQADLADLGVSGPLLRTRLQAEGAVLADDVVARPCCAGLVDVLVVALQQTVAPVPTSVAAGWGVPPAELLDRGRRQVLATEEPVVGSVDLGAGPTATLQTESPFAAVHLDRLGALVDVPPEGALVALPTRHLVLVAPLRDRAQALGAAQVLLLNAEELWRSGPGGLSPDLFWHRGGALVHLPGTPTSLAPPQEFLDVLDALPRG